MSTLVHIIFQPKEFLVKCAEVVKLVKITIFGYSNIESFVIQSEFRIT